MKIAGIQFACGGDKDKNVEKALRILDVALEEGARIVCFQELFSTHWFPKGRDEEGFSIGDVLTSSVVSVMQKKAAEAEIVLILPLFEKDGSKYYNSAIVIDADGKIAGTYRKIHVPDIPLWEEKFYFSPGDLGFPVFQTRHGTIGVQISWDNLYPECARILALKGANMIFAPTSCAFKSQGLWQTVVTGNAIANAVFIMRVNRVGSEAAHDFYGMSFCVGPEGELTGGPTGTSDGVLLAEADLSYLSEVRREWPIMKERRPDLYHEVLQGV
jgi:N-carbamoylputrescine amidase